MFKKIFYTLLMKGMIFWVQIRLPWILAKVYIGFEEYRQDDVYRERIQIDTVFAIKSFKKFSEWNFYYKKAVRRNPSLRWKRLFNPWQFEMPPLLETAGRSGI